MLKQINTAAEKFTRYGVYEGDRVAILSDNCPEFAIAVLALWKLRAIVVPISTRLPDSAIDELIEGVNADHFLDSPRLKYFVTCDDRFARCKVVSTSIEIAEVVREVTAGDHHSNLMSYIKVVTY